MTENEQPPEQEDQPDRPAGDDQRHARRDSTSNDGYSAFAYLLSGLIFYGGAGWLLDRWLGTNFIVLIGLLVGGAAAIYLIYVRYGRP